MCDIIREHKHNMRYLFTMLSIIWYYEMLHTYIYIIYIYTYTYTQTDRDTVQCEPQSNMWVTSVSIHVRTDIASHIHICCVASCRRMCIEYCRRDTHWWINLHICIVYEELMILYSALITFALRWCVVNYNRHHTTQCYLIDERQNLDNHGMCLCRGWWLEACHFSMQPERLMGLKTCLFLHPSCFRCNGLLIFTIWGWSSFEFSRANNHGWP